MINPKTLCFLNIRGVPLECLNNLKATRCKESWLVNHVSQTRSRRREISFIHLKYYFQDLLQILFQYNLNIFVSHRITQKIKCYEGITSAHTYSPLHIILQFLTKKQNLYIVLLFLVFSLGNQPIYVRYGWPIKNFF